MLRYESSCTVLVANEYTLLNRLRKPETRCPASGSFVAEHHLERAAAPGLSVTLHVSFAFYVLGRALRLVLILDFKL